MKIDVDQIVTVRKQRGKLFRKEYFGNHFWDIILLLYSHQVSERPLDAPEIASRLELGHPVVLRYLKVLLADGFVCGGEKGADDDFNIASDRLALTRQGFDNAGTVIHRIRKVFA